jgi:hypothetical protein
MDKRASRLDRCGGGGARPFRSFRAFEKEMIGVAASYYSLRYEIRFVVSVFRVVVTAAV